MTLTPLFEVLRCRWRQEAKKIPHGKKGLSPDSMRKIKLIRSACKIGFSLRLLLFMHLESELRTFMLLMITQDYLVIE